MGCGSAAPNACLASSLSRYLMMSTPMMVPKGKKGSPRAARPIASHRAQTRSRSNPTTAVTFNAPETTRRKSPKETPAIAKYRSSLPTVSLITAGRAKIEIATAPRSSIAALMKNQTETHTTPFGRTLPGEPELVMIPLFLLLQIKFI